MADFRVGTVFDRRRFVLTAAGTMGGAASLAWPRTAAAASLASAKHRVPPPNPIPGGIQLAPGVVIHVWGAGDPAVTLPFSGITLQGLDYEPCYHHRLRWVDRRRLPCRQRSRKRRQHVQPRNGYPRLRWRVHGRWGRPSWFVRPGLNRPVRPRFGVATARLQRWHPALGALLDARRRQERDQFQDRQPERHPARSESPGDRHVPIRRAERHAGSR